MKTHEPYVRVLNQSFCGYEEGTLGIVTASVSTRRVTFSILLDYCAEDTVEVPRHCLDTPKKSTQVAYLVQVFQFDPILAVRATMGQQIIRSLVEKLVKENIVVSKNDRCFALLEAAVQKKAIGRGVAVHFMDTLRGQLSEKKRKPTVFSLN